MSNKIKILSGHVVNRIAAGEVVERPASVVKELVENAIDAGATEISIDIEQAGRRLIRVTDNGSGMSTDDARIAFDRHATSKITTDADLESIRTMGFRGEALSSIAAVAQVRMVTAERGAPAATLVELEGGVIKTVSAAAAPPGTSLEISHLFYNTPARLKFQKSPPTEFSHILSAVSRQAMAHPLVRFRLTNNKKPVFDLPASMNVKERSFQLYGGEIVDNLMEFCGGRNDIHLNGLLGRPGFTRADKTYQEFYVNRRAVKNPSLTHALYSAYSDMLMRDRHPIGFIFMEIDPSLVDVNVHPAKSEVRFRNQQQIHDLVRDVIREGLRSSGMPGRSPADAGSGSDGVNEARSDYFQSLQGGTRATEPMRSLIPFGRRKSDVNSSGPHHAVPPPHLQAPFDASTPAAAAFDSLLVPLAQVHDSFIIAQSPEGMAIIDQHAAHERVLFEKLQDQYATGSIPVQNLLLPLQVELGPAQGVLLGDVLPDLGKLGLHVEDFGNGTFVVKAVPALLGNADGKRLLLDILDEVTVHGKSGKMEELRDETLSVMACHPAIKIHRKLDGREMEKLLDDLFKCRMPYTCPHGRPTVIRLSIEEIKRLFKRI